MTELQAVTVSPTRASSPRTYAVAGPARRNAGVFLLLTVAVLGAIWWRLVHHPVQADYFALFFSPVHLALAAALGFCVARLPIRSGKVAMVTASALVITGMWNARVLAYFVVEVLSVYAAVEWSRDRSAAAATAMVGIALAAGLAACWWLRSAVFQAISLWVWLVFRGISFAVDRRRGTPATLLDYLAYMFFYPIIFGTIEVYEEFYHANLTQKVRPDYGAAVRRLVMGFVRLTVSVAIPYTFNDVVQITSFFSGWGVVLAVYFKTVLFVTGWFDGVATVAHLYGYRIREAFPGVLLARNPREWWRSWRATMTHWLIRYVYIPLGGNRRHQTRNIAAVFAVSVLWHWIGFPFAGATTKFYPAYLPVLAWGVLNTVVMSIATRVARKPGMEQAEESPGLREFKVIATMVFGCATVIMLGYLPSNAGHFLDNLRVLMPTSVSWW